MSEDALLSPEQVAARLGISQWTLTRWRKNRKGPPFHRLGPRMIRYRSDELEEYVSSGANKAKPTPGTTSPSDSDSWGLLLRLERLEVELTERTRALGSAREAEARVQEQLQSLARELDEAERLRDRANGVLHDLKAELKGAKRKAEHLERIVKRMQAHSLQGAFKKKGGATYRKTFTLDKLRHSAKTGRYWLAAKDEGPRRYLSDPHLLLK